MPEDLVCKFCGDAVEIVKGGYVVTNRGEPKGEVEPECAHSDCFDDHLKKL